MIDIEEKDLLDLLNALTTIQNEDGEPMPNYCFATDITTDLDCSEEEVSKFSLEHGYKVFKVFSGETMVGGMVIVPEGGTIEPVEKMYDEFYGEVPEISEIKLDDSGNIIEVDELTEKKKKAKRSIVARDPNAQAMWGRTRSQTFKAKRGKGSFTRHPKHKGLHENSNEEQPVELDEIDFGEMRKASSEGYMNKIREEFERLGASITFLDDLYEDRQYAFWYGPVARIEYNNYTIEVFTSEYGEFELDGERITMISRAEELGLFSDDDLEDANVDWIEDDNFWAWIEKDGDESTGMSVQSDLNYEAISMLEDALNAEAIINRVIPDYEETLSESLNEKKENELTKRAKKHKRTDKKGAMGWFNGSHPKGATLIPNAGNVELNIAHFNHVMGSDSTATATDGGASVSVGCCEDVNDQVDLDVGNPYVYTFSTLKKFATRGYDFDDDNNGERPRAFWYAKVPESAMKVSREDFLTNKLLRKRKNKEVMQGVKKFFLEHPSAKWCVIECQDQSKHDKYINVYRTLIEGLGEAYSDDYYVVSDGKNPRHSSVFSKNGMEDAINLAKSMPGYYEVLHYVNGEPSIVWKKDDIKEDVDDIELDIAKPRKSPSGVTFEAHDREDFMSNRGYWGRYPEFKCPQDGIQIFKSELNKYLFVKSAKEVIERYFKENPRRQYCVLLATKNGHRIDVHNLFGDKLIEKITEDVEKHDTLNPKIWNDDNTLKDEVRNKIMEIVNDFTTGLENDGIKFIIKDIKLVGSNCSYNYNDKSDLDLHIVMDTDSLECPDDLYPLLYSAYRSLWNKNHDVNFYGIPVEIFVETDDTVQMNDEKDVDKE